jgi:hypothetical protein
MISYLLEFAVVAVIAFYFFRWRAAVRRRNTQSWDSIVSRLRTDWNANELNAHLRREEVQRATPEENWQRIHGAEGLCAMYQNAGVMLEMADYVARNSDSVDRELLGALRSDATQIRVRILMALTQYAVRQVNEGISANALSAASMYAEMASRTRQLLQVNAGFAMPAYSGSMA